jgi:hypothetical protein
MANYKQATLAAQTWQRAKQVTITNTYDAVPTIAFQEEQVIDINGKLTLQDIGVITKDLSTPTASFKLVSPVDGSVLGTATYQDVYVMLSSLYLDLATKRDLAS